MDVSCECSLLRDRALNVFVETSGGLFLNLTQSDLEAISRISFSFLRFVKSPCSRLWAIPVHILGEVSPRSPTADAPASAVDPSARAAPAPGAGPAAGAVAPLAVHEEGHRDP